MEGKGDDNSIIENEDSNSQNIQNIEKPDKSKNILDVENSKDTSCNISINLDTGNDSLNVTMTSTPAKKLIELTSITPIKEVESSSNTILSSHESLSKFPMAQSPITPIDKVVKLGNVTMNYSPVVDGRGDSLLVSQNILENVLPATRVKTPMKLKTPDSNEKVEAVKSCAVSDNQQLDSTSNMDNTAESDAFSMDGSF